jgi:putative tricarboxylic transport membrane protein
MPVPRRVFAPLAGALLAVVLLLHTRGLDAVARGGQLGPGFWPRLALLALAVACLAQSAGEWRRHRAADPAAPARVDTRALEADIPPAGSRSTLVVAIALILLYVALTPIVGFAVATTLFIAAFMYVCGMRSMVALGLNALLGTTALLYLFIRLVYLPLPKGEGPFEAVSLTLYRALGIF